VQKNIAEYKSLVRDRKPDLPLTYISRYWYYRFLTLSIVGPLINRDVLCEHGLINVTCKDVKDKLKLIPIMTWEHLVRRFGGNNTPIKNLTVCPKCEARITELNIRREKEKKGISIRDRTSLSRGEYWYLTSKEWLDSWRRFALEGVNDVPGPINNSLLLQADAVTPKLGLSKGQHYRGVTKAVWMYFIEIYSGGPPIIRNIIDIYSEPVKESKI